MTGTRDLRVQVVALALEHRMRPDLHAQIQVAGGAAVGAGFAFAGGAHARAVLDAGRNPHVDAARVAALLDRDPPRRAVKRLFERQLDLVLDVAPLLVAAARARRGRVPLRARQRRRRRRTC